MTTTTDCCWCWLLRWFEIIILQWTYTQNLKPLHQMPCHTSSSLHSSFHPSILFNDSWCCNTLIMQGCCVTPAVCCCYLLFMKLGNGSCRKVVMSLSKVMWLPSLLGCPFIFIFIHPYYGLWWCIIVDAYSPLLLILYIAPAPTPGTTTFLSLFLLPAPSGLVVVVVLVVVIVMIHKTMLMCGDDFQSQWYSNTPTRFLLPQTCDDDDECWWFTLRLSPNLPCQKLLRKLITMKEMTPPLTTWNCLLLGATATNSLSLFTIMMRLPTPATSCSPTIFVLIHIMAYSVVS